MQNHASYKESNPREAWTNLGRALEDHPLLKARQLSPGDYGPEEATLAMEYRAFEEILSIDVKYNCIHILK